MKFATPLAALTCATVALAAAHAAQALTLYPTNDTYIQESSPTTDASSSTTMEVRSYATGGRQQVAYIQFDLSALTAPITQVAFGITVSPKSGNGTSAGQINLYGLNNVPGNTPQNWTTLTYGPNSASNPNGAGAEINSDSDATTHDMGTTSTTSSTNLWSLGPVPGYTKNTTTSTLLTMDDASNPELLNFLNSRRGGFATLLLIEQSNTNKDLFFDSGAGTAGTPNDQSLWPYLTITTSTAVPEPASLGVLGAGGLLLIARRRRE
jgi:hypothetical protein